MMSLTDLGVAVIKLLPPEAAHTTTIRLLKERLGVPVNPPATHPTLAVKLPKSGLVLSGPVGLAAGFDKNCDVPDAMAKFGFGFVECGTVTPRPQAGNPKPRLFRLSEDRAVINRMGFNNAGLDYFVRNLKTYRGEVPVGANVGANKDSEDRVADYAAVLRRFAGLADFFTINVSSPNTEKLRDLQGRAALDRLLADCLAVRDDAAPGAPVLLKISPDLDDQGLADVAEVCLARGIDGIVATNTTLSRDGLHGPHASETSGLSGAPLFEKSTRVLARLYDLTGGKLPLIGVGRIGSPEDAYAKIRAGASAVQLYTALVYHGLSLGAEIARGLDALLERDGFATVAEAVGTSREEWL